MDEADLWSGIEAVAMRVADEFRDAGVLRIEATPYRDSLGRAGAHFTVWLRDKPNDADYEWPELHPIESKLSMELQQLDADRIPYTDYVLESDAAERSSATTP